MSPAEALTSGTLLRSAHREAEVVKAVENADLRERLTQLGATPVGSSADELAAYVRAELDRWGRAVKAANLKLE